jgi:WD40 repeat protein
MFKLYNSMYLLWWSAYSFQPAYDDGCFLFCFVVQVIPGVPGSTIESIVWIRPTPQHPSTKQQHQKQQNVNSDDEMSDDDDGGDYHTSEEQTEGSAKTNVARLFTAGLDGCITEWNMTTLSPYSRVESGGGAIWCMTASPAGDELAIGCEDGCVRVFSVGSKPGDSVTYKATFDRQDGML